MVSFLAQETPSERVRKIGVTVIRRGVRDKSADRCCSRVKSRFVFTHEHGRGHLVLHLAVASEQHQFIMDM